MNSTEEIKKALQEFSDPEKAEFLPEFFKTMPGGTEKETGFWG